MENTGTTLRVTNKRDILITDLPIIQRIFVCETVLREPFNEETCKEILDDGYVTDDGTILIEDMFINDKHHEFYTYFGGDNCHGFLLRRLNGDETDFVKENLMIDDQDGSLWTLNDHKLTPEFIEWHFWRGEQENRDNSEYKKGFQRTLKMYAEMDWQCIEPKPIIGEYQRQLREYDIEELRQIIEKYSIDPEDMQVIITSDSVLDMLYK